MSETVHPPIVSESVADPSAQEALETPVSIASAQVNGKAQQVLQRALDTFSQSPDWVIFFRDVLGAGGIIHETFQGDELAAFQRCEEYARIQEMLTELRVRPKLPDQEVEPTRVITVRLPQTLHEALKAEAHDRETSMNQLCISKLVQLIDEKLVPKD